MGRVIVNEFLSLDGVAQAPGGANEDRDDGFQHGGWHMAYMDEVSAKWVGDGMAEAGGFLLGRRTYEIFAAYWPIAPEEEGESAARLNGLPKYVVSNTLREPLEWQNSKVLRGDVPESVGALRNEPGKELHVWGSTQLVRALVRHDLVDEFRVMIDPVTLGGGKRIFPEDHGLRSFRLVNGQVTGTGALLATYGRR